MNFRNCFCSMFLFVFAMFCCGETMCFEDDSAGEFAFNANSPQFSALSDEQKQLLTEFSTNYRSLVKFYENVRIDAEQSNEKYVFRARGGNHYRMDVQDTARQQEKNENILFVTPSLYSDIKRNDSSDEFYVNDVQTEKSLDGIGNFYHYRFWLAPYGIEYLPMKYCVFVKPGFADDYRVSQLTQSKDGVNDLVTIETQFFQKGNLEIIGTFTFYRNLSWAIKETKWEYVPKKEARYSLVEYSGDENGIPLLSKVTYWYTDSNDTTPVDQITKKDLYVCKVNTDPIPYSEFDVEQYVKIGLPEPNHRYLFLRLTLIVLGIVLIAWGLSRALLKK